MWNCVISVRSTFTRDIAYKMSTLTSSHTNKYTCDTVIVHLHAVLYSFYTCLFMLILTILTKEPQGEQEQTVEVIIYVVIM